MHKLDPGAARQRGGCGRSRWNTVFPGGSRAVLLVLLAGAVLAGGAAHPAYGQVNANDSVKRWNSDEIWKPDTSDCDEAFQTCMETTEPVTENVTVTLYWCEGRLPSYAPVDGVQCIARQHIETIYHHQFGTCLAKFNQCVANKRPRACVLEPDAPEVIRDGEYGLKWATRQGARRGSGKACVCEMAYGPPPCSTGTGGGISCDPKHWGHVRGTNEACEVRQRPPGAPPDPR